eukprot:890425_1
MAQPTDDELHKKLQQLVHISHYLRDTLIKPSTADVSVKKMYENHETHSLDKMTQTEAQYFQSTIQSKPKEKGLDHEAGGIATQTPNASSTFQLPIEMANVQKQKEHWQKLVNEVQEYKAVLDRREAELQINHKKLLDLHETLCTEKKKLHKKAKKIKARERRLDYALYNYHQTHMSSEYGEQELTYFSDGDCEIAFANSISDDEITAITAYPVNYDSLTRLNDRHENISFECTVKDVALVNGFIGTYCASIIPESIIQWILDLYLKILWIDNYQNKDNRALLWTFTSRPDMLQYSSAQYNEVIMSSKFCIADCVFYLECSPRGCGQWENISVIWCTLHELPKNIEQ